MDAERKFSSALTVDALSQAIPQQTITAVLQAEAAGEARERTFTMVVVVWLVIAMNLYTALAASAVMRKLARGLRFIWINPQVGLPTDSAITYRRYQLGARPLVAVVQQVCHPIATAQTRGAFLFGLRLMALDGTVENVPDTPANAAAVGRHPSQRGGSAFPQVQGVYLVECGTHVVVDAGFWPCQTSERVGGHRLLRSVGRGMLVMWDRGFHDYNMMTGARQRGAHVLSRLPAHVTPQRLRTLPDGSYLAYLFPSAYPQRKQGERILVRGVEDSLTDPALPGFGEVHRLVTSLLNPCYAPAHDLACAYHERWEIELVIDEIDTHQRLSARTLRSLKPVGVIQELSALLLAHYAIRVLMHEAALRAAVDPDRLSFVHALEVVRAAIPEFQMTTPAQLPQLQARLLDDIATKRLPERRPRSNARAVKRKMSKVQLKRPEHYRPPRPKGSFRDAVAVCGASASNEPSTAPETNAALVLELLTASKRQGAVYLELCQRERCLI